MWRLVASLWVLTLTAVVTVQSSSPVITNFLAKDLVNPEDVKFNAEEGFRLPCKATGSNLKWTWKHNDVEIAAYNGYPYLLDDDGTLEGSYLRASASGTYQCFVKDEETGAVEFSRKLKVAVTVVGKFINPTNVVVKVNLGDPFSYACPPRKHSYGVVFSWGNSDITGYHTFARNDRRSISSNGTLLIMYLTQNDIDEIESYKGIRCIISGANSFQRSGTLRLEKYDKDQKDSMNSTLPVWSATPNAQETAVQGKNKNMFCFASGRPSPTITWKKDGQTIVHNQDNFKIYRSFFGRLLFIQNINQNEYEGIYTCEAENDFNTGNPISFNSTLKVEVPPKWVSSPPPKNISIVIENNGTLECHVTADPAPVVTWYKDGAQLQSSKHCKLDGAQLHLIEVTLDEAGVYQCEAANEHGMITSSTSVDVLAWKPSFANVQFGPFDLLNYKEARLPCQPSTAAPPPTFQWFREDELITYDENSRYKLDEDGTLVIKQIDKDQDAVNYTCKAQNFKGAATVSAVINVLVPPSLIKKPTDQTVIENEDVTLLCTANGNPVPDIVWTKDGKTVAQGDTLSLQANRDHSGKYWCSADNGLSTAINASAILNVLFSPSLITQAVDQILLENEIATFYCNATGNPTPKITWTKDGMTAGEGETLSFVTDRNQSGEYWCSADNGLNSTVNASANLDVQFPPSLTKKPSDQTVTENEDVTLHCTSNGNPVPDIVWTKDGNTVAQGDTLSLQANRDHSGKYWCSADNGLSTSVNASADLNVLFSPSLISRPNDQTIIEGAAVTFYCNATGNPTPKITWTKDGKTVREGDILSFVTDRNQSGEYLCSADNGLNSTVNASANLDVQFPPSLTAQPSDQTVIENEEVTLHCSAIGNPIPEITWLKDGKTVGSDETLIFDALRDHSGKYWCSADNGLGGAVNASADIDVQFSPSLISRPNDQTIIEGATVTFYCNATGNPTPKITWTKDGKTVATGDTLSFKTDRNQSGKYLCSADNGLNSTVNASANLDVQFPPSLTTQPSDQTVIENEEVTLHCSAIGNPVPEITWLKDGKTVGSDETLIFDALRDHSGKYWCSADNGLGEAVNTSADIDVQFSPSLISRPNDQTIIEGAAVTFYCNATGNPTPKITWTKDGKTVGEGDILSFVTDRNQSGEYLCSADNGLNSTVNASANLDVQFPPSLTAQPSDQTVIENEEVTLHCSAIGNPVPEITWLKDGKTVGSDETLIFDAVRDHSGKYWCSADNGLGEAVNTSADIDVQFSPSLISRPNDQTIIEGATVTFYCNATGNPTPKITWTKNGKTVGEGDTLSFKTDRNQSGEYWCSADNGLNSTVNASTNLDVQFPPSLTKKPSDQTVFENEDVILLCIANGNPVPDIVWTKDGKTVAQGDTLSLQANRDHSGKYWCSADNGLSTSVNASADLNVLFSPSLISRPNDQTIIEGAAVTFYCNATGNPTPKITWTKDGKTVREGDTLSFKTDRNQSGKYLCSADNGLNSTVNASANLDVQFPPSLTAQPSDQTVIENEEVTLHCSAIGNPVPEITWLKDGKTVGSDETLIFDALRAHSGKYWCSVDNGLGEAVNASADIDVQFSPSLISRPNDQTIIEGAAVTFYCNATGNPTPKITWTKDGETVATGDTLSFKTDRNQSGEYWCSADNGLNSTVNTSANLDVQFPPSLTAQPSDQTVTENEEVTLDCSAIGNPVPEITWLKDGKTVGSDETLIFDALRDHSGKYWCSADNGLGEAVNTSADIDVQFSPSLISRPNDQTIIEGAAVTFYCNATGNPTPKITWTKNGKTVGEGDTLSCKTDRNQSGEYWCSADNGLNSTVNASANLDVQFPPSLTSMPSDQTVTENEEVTLRCTAIGNPVPEIEWIKDGETVGAGVDLSFKAVRDNSGKYWCSVKNGLGITMNASAELDVQFPPSLTTTPADQTVIEGAMATFRCTATGNPTPNITWTTDGKTVGTGETLSFATDRNQSGEYLCSADNGSNSTVNARASLDVQFPPSLITKPSDQTLTESEQVAFHCTATGNPAPNITWVKDGMTVGTGDILRIAANRSDSGKYWCLAKNELNVTVNASASLDVQFAPGLTSKPNDTTIIEGAIVTFYCNATGNPMPKITWTKDGKTVATGDTLRFVTDRNQSGEYLCSADNGLNVTVKAIASLDVQFPPSLTIKPSDQTVMENRQVNLHCSAMGNPVPKITWKKDGKTVVTGNTLDFKALRNHSGIYICVAKNGLNVTVDASAHLDVQFTPSLTSGPSDQTVIEGATATFHCNATGNPTPKITWTKDGNTVATGDTLKFITDRNQSGEYLCSADNGLNSTVNASASLDVQFPPSLTIKPSDQTVTEKQQLNLHCAAIGNPVPKITWIKDGMTVGTGNTLSLEAIRNHSGNYLCMAQNGLDASVNAAAHVDVQFPPSLISNPNDQTVIEGATATFHCNATGNPTPKITWTKGGKTVATVETLSFVTDRNQSGEYLCSADNGLNSTVKASVTLDVQFPPRLTIKPANRSVVENEQLTLHCTAIGNPVPEITWIKDGKTVGQGDSLSFGVEKKDSGKYWCSADNGLGVTSNASAVLDVQFPPSLQNKPTNQTILEGTNVTFICSATGNPTPKITWIKDGKTVANADTMSFVANRNQSGKYWCSADNGLSGAVNASAELDVQFPPSLTAKPSDQTVIENEQLSFHCTATGNPVPKITWIKDGKIVGSGDTLSIGVQRNHSGRYWCSANNGLSEAVNASAELDVQFPPSLQNKPTNQMILEGTNVTFICSATGNPTPKITWIKDGKTVANGDTLSFVANRNQSGKYWCSADNGLSGAVNASAELDVQFPPSLTAKPSDQTVIENEQLSFHCTATGNPVPKITWIKDGKIVGSGDTLSIGVQRNHSGKYWCSVDNGLSEAVNASAELDVQFPPTLLTSPTDASILEGTNVTLICSATGNPTPNITWIKDGKTVANGDTLAFVANRNQSGKYWCSANNGLSTAVNASADLDVKFPPSLTTKPSNQTVSENKKVTFHCTSIGNPVSKITWTKDGKTVGEGDTLSIEAHRDNSGKYWCSADNGLNSTVNASADLVVEFPPSLITTPANQTLLEAVTVTFHCTATGNPVPTITWIKDGKPVGIGETLSFQAFRNQSGKYWCSVDNGLNSTVNASANLDVQYLPSFTSEPTDQTINEAAMATFHCEATGNPSPKITWIKDGKTVGTGNMLSFNANRNQSGEYSCSADNGLGRVINASATLDVHYAPSLITRPTNQTIIEADNATFRCTAIGNPTPKITWLKDGKTVTTGETLMFAPNRNQSGEYWCSADNGLNSTVNASAYLDVQYLPNLVTKAVNQTVNETAQVSFYCSAAGNPVPKITWFKDGKRVGTGSKLNFTALRSHSGKYWCLVNNGLNATVNSIAFLNVQFPPSFTKLPLDHNVTEGDESTFSCTAIGNPVPVITWIKDGKPVGKGSTLNLIASRSETGEYWCLADNGLGKPIKAGSHLNVQYPPSLTTTPVDQILSEKTTATFHCAAIGNPVPKIKWMKAGKTVGAGNTLRFAVQRGQSGQYWCTADNGFNKTVNASAYLDVLFPPSLTTQPTDQAVMEFTEATFHCNATGNPTPKITWTKDGKTVATGETLKFAPSRNQSGEYRCSADNGLNTTANASANLDVQFPPSLTIKPSDQTVTENEEVTLRCTAIGNPVPKITWIKDGKTVGSEETLSFDSVRDHSGKYWCSAHNGLGEAVNASADIDVQFPPSLTTQPTDQAVMEFTEATFHCNATGNPTPKITWTKDGKTVATGETLMFAPNRNQSGEYLCSADNGLNSTVNASADLDVQFSPSFTIEPNDETVLEMDIMVLHCSATGNPTPMITWIKDGKTVARGDTLSFVAYRNQSGEYLCSVDNGLSEAVNTSAYIDVQFPPSFTTTPLNKTVVEGDETTFRCTAIGNPVPNMKWSNYGKTVDIGEMLRFAANRNQSGEYLCSVENGLGSAINASAYLDVQFAPSITTTPIEQTITEGLAATFHCAASGNPTPEIKWMKDGGIAGSGETLTFGAFRDDSGEYWCIANNGFNNTAKAGAFLDVQFAPSFIIVPSDQIVNEKAQTTFTCTATGNPVPNITWSENGKTVGTGDTLSFEASRNRSGVYWCLAENGIDAINSSVNLDVHFSPSFAMQPTNKTVTEGATTTFYCNATGNPAPKIRWIKDGKTVGEEDTLTFVAKRNHSGKYWCSAENGFNATVQAIAYLDVQFPPSFTTIPTEQTVKEGDEATFHCVAIGNPSPKITWHRDGNNVATGDSLRLAATNRNDSGKYLCSAGNGVGLNINTSAHLDVQFPPSLTATPDDQTAIEGTKTTFHCTATGNPTPKITWTKDGKTVGEGDTLSFVTDRNQSGEYLCSANNGLNSTVNACASLDVQFPPHFTATPVDQTVNEADEATFSCTATGNPVPTIKWIKDGNTVGTGERLSFEAFKNQSGKYWCSANNGLGSPINSSFDLVVRFLPSWSKRPANQTVIEGEKATLHCSATGNPTPKITWTKEGKTVATGDTLSFKASRHQSGEYRCSAENVLGKPINASAYIDVKYPTSLASTPTDQTVKEGDEITLHCNATGNPNPNITWSKDGKTVATGETLKFQANRNDSGKYWCSADNGLGLAVNTSAYVNVQFPPQVTIKSIYVTVIEGAVATLHCAAIGNPVPKITWTKDGKTVGTGDTLRFEATRNQSGDYWCSAESDVFNKPLKASSHLDVHFKPERTRLTANKDLTDPVQFGSFVKLNCTTYSHPDVDGYKFYRDQELIGSNTSGIYHVQLQRSGVYACVPFNSAGNGKRASLKIQVHAWKPSFDRVSFGPFYLFKGNQARLSCKPFAEPYPTLRWFKDGAAISYGQNNSYRLDTDGSLIIDSVKDENSGKYTCMAQNYLGKANATADGILLERTEIVVRPQNQTVTPGTHVVLRCKATVDPLLELIYIWKRDGADITGDSNILWMDGGNVLNLPDITFEEAGVYTCVVYTPEPRGSEDIASAIVSITGVPSPPSHLQLTDCHNRRTNLSWSPIISNSTHITNYLIEQESNHHPNVFKLVYNVTDPVVTSVSLNLPGWCTLRFRVKAVSSVGPSRPSVATTQGICTTPVGVPKKYPSNLRGVPTKANELSITWDPVPETEWDAPGFYCVLKYRKVNLGFLSDWKEEKIGDPSVSVFAVSNAGNYQLWEFKLRTGNHEGPGPESPIKRSFSGQDAPAAKPETTEVGVATSSSVVIAWKPVTVKKGSVDGYKIYYWGESRSVSSRRRRETIPSTAEVITVMGSKTQQAALTGLKPYTNYKVVVKAFNTGGEGPAGDVMVFETVEGEPGPPSDVQIYPFGEFIVVTWKPPKEPNGIITNYQVGSAEYSGASPENVTVAMETVGSNVLKKLLGNSTFEKSYVVVVRAQTSQGWGASAREITRTLTRMAPAKPDKLTVVGTDKALISLRYNYGIGGGWTHEFKILYRKKEDGGEFQETDWVDHLSTQFVDINNLESEVYEFKSVGKNSVGTGPESDVIAARPQKDPVVSGRKDSPPVYQSDWFITLIILSAGTLLLLVIIIVYRRWKRRRNSNYKVTEHEKETEKEEIEQGPPVDIKLREQWKKQLHDRVEEESQDSLDEYGGDEPYFAEDGSFVGDLQQGRNRESVYDEIPLEDPAV